MRSDFGIGEEQACLPFDPPASPDPDRDATRSSGGQRRPAKGQAQGRAKGWAKGQGASTVGDSHLRHRLTTDALASLGWPAGTELVLGPCRTPRRGQVVLALDGVHQRIGIFEVQMGRAALRTDHGSVWIGPRTEFLGAVTLAGAPFAGMPDPE